MRNAQRLVVLACSVSLLASCASDDGSKTQSPSAGVTTIESSDPAKADAVLKLVRDSMAAAHLKSVILRVTIDGKEIVTQALGDSMTGVPATTDMHFRNGAVAISYVSTVLLQLVDEKKVSLDDKVSKWLPDLPNADRVTLGQLAHMTSGYVDYVLGNPEFAAAIYADPFKNWTTDELLGFAVNKPLFYDPGTNWNYAHTNYVILGLALEKITGKPMATLIKEKVLDPLGLNNTVANQTAVIPEPVLHAFTSEWREYLKVAPGTRFYEESTFFNPSWTITNGAVETTNIFDLHDSAVAIGSGKLLSPESYKAMVSPELRGKTTALPGCPTCAPQDEAYTYGLGIVIVGNWLMQNPLFFGYSSFMGYLPSRKIAIAVSVTYAEDGFTERGDYRNEADALGRAIGALLAPDDAPAPLPKK
ncbi:serine hydrolase domain-containing protein [Antrihabitans stalactiti]|uniref:Beta-lactamase family protein n=1 Tax=Antrihabitans stalactiti TaxID=2584121 RepID=A0A848KH08_9NOCA|nr:serine hydrolase domain-containing protein [Antrihabitans stalactiti]NMN97451.1 beta-lactamase family protein [Antrihabitans stalactiti]